MNLIKKLKSVFRILPVLCSDSYKQFHYMMYPEGMTRLYSNGTPRSLRHIGARVAVFFGLQYYIKEYLIRQWQEEFFDADIEIIKLEYKRFHKYFSGVDDIDTTHIEKLHALGYLPLKIKALPEGAKVKAKVPFYTITNTVDGFGWLVNFLETPMSNAIWHWSVVATIANQYREVLNKYAIETTGSTAGVEWQGHDFSMRGLSSVETDFSQLAWLLFFRGTDTIPAVLAAEEYYNANMEEELIGASVPATEHSVMTSYGKESEIDAFKRIMKLFPKGIVSIVSDSFDLWKVLTVFILQLKEQILARDGKLVIRPDSGDPVDIICGLRVNTFKNTEEANDYYDDIAIYSDENVYTEVCKIGSQYFEAEIVKTYHKDFDGPSTLLGYKLLEDQNHPKYKGVIELLWDVFGGTINEQGYKVLDSHVGAIYGDSITLERATAICERLKAKGFATTNIVLGVGSYTMNYNTRDSIGFAVKSTWCEVEYDENGHLLDHWMSATEYNGPKIVKEAREIFKDPITDDGTKKSAKGLLAVFKDENGEYYLKDQCDKEEENSGELQVVFEDGKIVKDWTLAEVREIANN